MKEIHHTHHEAAPEKREPDIYIPAGQGEPDYSHPAHNKLSDKVVDEFKRDDGETERKKYLKNPETPILLPLPRQKQPSDPEISIAKVREIAAKVQPSNVEISVGAGLTIGRGFGTVISKDGYVLTNAHVAERGAAGLTVITSDRREFPAQVVKIDQKKDLALLRTALPIDSIHPLPFAAQMVDPGAPVYQFGSPIQSETANPNGSRFTISPGVFDHRGVNREAFGDARLIAPFNFVTSKELREFDDIAARPSDVARLVGDSGSSGGALTNKKAELVGVHALGSVDHNLEKNYRYAFSIPLSEVKSFLSSSDPALKPKLSWTRNELADAADSLFRADPIGNGFKPAMYAIPAGLLLSGKIPDWTKGIPVLGRLGRAAHNLTSVGAFGVATGLGLVDLHDLAKSNNSREAIHSTAAVLADSAILYGVLASSKYRAIPKILGIVGRAAAEFVPYKQTYEQSS